MIDKIYIFIIITLFVIATFVFYSVVKKQQECNNRGGILINGACIKVEKI